jgi:hypothetical protein
MCYLAKNSRGKIMAGKDQEFRGRKKSKTFWWEYVWVRWRAEKCLVATKIGKIKAGKREEIKGGEKREEIAGNVWEENREWFFKLTAALQVNFWIAVLEFASQKPIFGTWTMENRFFMQ